MYYAEEHMFVFVHFFKTASVDCQLFAKYNQIFVMYSSLQDDSSILMDLNVKV